MTRTVRRSLAVLAALCVVLGACSNSKNPVSSKPVLSLSKSGVGTCLQVGTSITAEVSHLPVVDCSVPHTHEIYATVALTDQKYPVYPGTEVLDGVAQHDCTAAFQPYVGTGPFDSALFFSWLLPTLNSWNDKGDRTILCVASRFDAGKLTGSVKGSKL